MPEKIFEGVIALCVAIMMIIMTGLSTWMFKLDDRQFDLQSQIVTQDQFRIGIDNVENRLDARFDRLEDLLEKMIDRELDRNGP